MSDYVYAIGPNGNPIRYPASVPLPEGVTIISEREAMQMIADIEAADHLAMAAILLECQQIRINTLTSLTSGVPLSAAESLVLSTHSLVFN